MKKYLFQFFIVITSIFMILSCSSEKAEKPGVDTQAAATTRAGGSGMAFNAYDLDGNLHSSTEFAGKPMIVNIWGTWCPPCRMEMPAIQKIYEEYNPKGLEIIGLATERNPNNQEGVRRFVDENGYTWTMWMADQDNKRALGLGGGVPYTVFIDRDGKVVNTHTGIMQYNQFKEYVEKIL